MANTIARRLSRISLLAWALLPLVSFLLAVASPSVAQEWPQRQPIKMLVGYPPGGSADALARDLLPGLSKALGQTVVIEYKPGAGGAIGAELTAKAVPDGYTIGLLDNGPLSVQGNFRKLPFDPLTSFTPITGISKLPFVLLMNPQVPAKDLSELVALIRKKPGAFAYSTSGQGSMHHISGELFKNKTKTHIVHIPYRGAAPALIDLAGGQVQLSFATIVPSVPFIQNNQVRAVAVTSATRSALLPNVPTLVELGLKDFDSQGWFAIFGPANLPPNITAKLVAAFKTTLEDPTLLAKPSLRGSELMIGTPEQLQSTLKNEASVIAKLIKDQNITAD
jgi:tripartite-type tricarboxylate transporter receptor subunit TctC